MQDQVGQIILQVADLAIIALTLLLQTGILRLESKTSVFLGLMVLLSSFLVVVMCGGVCLRSEFFGRCL